MKIGIISRHRDSYTTKRLADCARARGCAAWVMDPFDIYIHIRGKGSSVYYRSKPVDDIDVLIPRLSKATARYGLEVLHHFELAGVPSVNPESAISVARNKFRSLAVLASNAVPVPPTFAGGSTDYLDRAANRTGEYPFILKPFEGTQGKGIVIAETPLTLRSVLDAFWSLYQDYIAQPFYEEASGRDIRALVVGGKVVCSMKRIAQNGEFRANIHRGAIGHLTELDDREKDLARKAAQVIGLGIAGVDMIRTNEGTMVIEVNPSPGFEGLEKATGIDVARQMIDYAISLAQSGGA